MRLKHIKLAGFKSFVDPTKVPFEQQMTAIVGPNGCGKSNIIDAVRWVLGESSAKNLRGDAMTDVIFNGAASRKPIGQASVELVFDNTSGRIQGNMADRSQVSIRRIVNRDSVNSYFLNGSKCRRRDITDIFLGTGLGPRSYAIIEQGTIARLIESKPQELRVFIEEAAGISKYKERRRETENRIRHTRENLARLNDIRVELSVQIDKLHQQAEAAKRFRTLKQQERKHKAELAVLRWQKFDQQRQHHHTQILAFETKVAGQNSQLIKNDAIILDLKASIISSNDNSQELQQQKLAVTQDIARAEQNVKYLKEQADKTKHDNEQTQQQLINAQKLILAEQEQLALCQVKLDEKLPQLQIIESQLTQNQQQLTQLQLTQSDLQKSWQLQQQQLASHQQSKLSISSEITQQETIVKQIQEQKVRLVEQLEKLPTIDLSQQLKLQSEHQQVLAQLAQQQQQFAQNKINIDQQQQLLTQYNQQLAVLSVQEQTTKQDIARLQRKQVEPSAWHEAQTIWLNEKNISTRGRLQSKITVENGWENAVDVVLSYWLNAEVVAALPPVDAMQDNKADNLCLIIPADVIPLETKANTLAGKVSGMTALNSLLNGIYLALDYQDAQSQLQHLLEHESVICADGTWLSRHMLRKGNIESGNDYLSSQRLLSDQQIECDKILAQQSKIAEQQRTITQQTELAQEQQKILAEDISQQQQVLKQHEHADILLQQENNHQQAQQQNLAEQLAILNNEKIDAEKALVQGRLSLEALPVITTGENEQLAQQQVDIQAAIQTLQNTSQTLHQQRHQLALVVEQLKSQKLQREQTIFSNQDSIQILSQRQQQNSQSVADNSTPLREFEQNLPLWLDNLSAINEKLAFNQKSLNDDQTLLAELELGQKTTQHKISALKEQLSRLNLDSEGFKLRAENALEVLADLQQTVEDVLTQMPVQAKESLWQAQLIKLARDINLLGPINLAAIDEYETQFQRKNYLDQQDHDLTSAIATLEAAIAKIDRESRHKFKLTFEQINHDLQHLFPKVFGGGSAYLELTGDDLLDTGVTIMARPPGKKNSTIHLLSGGEKALTALSLVFAIFRLNPAPFCMLDEVDAPLDDANVGRFCNLVKEMSETVQFIYISHNKIAMEMASHLTGVTMFEPGVSRMVAVDIEEAIAMAEE